MTNKKSFVYVFAMPHGQTELENVVPIEPQNHTDFINPQGWNVEKKYGAKICYGHYHFRDNVTLATIASFIQELRDSMDTTLYFALRKNGRIWVVDKSGEDDIVHTPEGPLKISIVEGGTKAGLIRFEYLDKPASDSEEEKIEKIIEETKNEPLIENVNYVV